MKLNGLNGIVYLMFLGRETYARESAQKLVKLEFIKDEDSIYPVIKKLKDAEIIKEIKTKKNKPGNPEIRTATFKPFFSLLKIVEPTIMKEDLERIKKYIQYVGGAIPFFPDHLRMIYDISEVNIRKLKWPKIAATYLNFILGLLIFINSEEKFDTKAYSKVTSEIFDKKILEKHFNPMREALGKVSKDLEVYISNEHYRDDVILIAELSNRILYGPKYIFMKNTLGYAARKQLAAYYTNEIK